MNKHPHPTTQEEDVHDDEIEFMNQLRNDDHDAEKQTRRVLETAKAEEAPGDEEAAFLAAINAHLERSNPSTVDGRPILDALSDEETQ